MKEGEYNIWYLPHSMEVKSVTDALASKFTFELERSRKEKCTYFDTFDWRLHKQGFYLQKEKAKWLLTRIDTKEQIELTNGPRSGKRIFSWDFPVGELRTILQGALSVRALLALATLKSTERTIRILNKKGKTVAFLVFKELQKNGTDKNLRTVTLQGVQGYKKKKKAIRRLLQSSGIIDNASPLYAFEEGLRRAGRVPGDYTSKFSIQLNPDSTARQAAIAIYSQLLTTMRRNEDGILKDLDSEFLHDFRVAVRRTRSGLVQMKDAMSPEMTNHFKAEFACLGRMTGPTRDLDVYLLYEEDYKARLPPDLQTALQVFFADLAGRRTEEQKKLVRALKAKRYRQIINEWQHYLEDDNDAASAPGADVPVIDLARKTILRRYKKIMKAGMVITLATPDENLHNLRIHGKKLRYSLEFFASLFPKDEINKVIKQLKQLQSTLGDFNDLSVQQEMLHSYLDGLRPGSRRNFELATAIGGLLTNLYHEQCLVREKFFTTFNHFNSRENVAFFRGLFS